MELSEHSDDRSVDNEFNEDNQRDRTPSPKIEYNIENDIKLGWVPQYEGLSGPIPFAFSSYSQMSIIRPAELEGRRLLYRGPRPADCFELHESNIRTGSIYEVKNTLFEVYKNKHIKEAVFGNKNIESESTNHTSKKSKNIAKSRTAKKNKSKKTVKDIQRHSSQAELCDDEIVKRKTIVIPKTPLLTCKDVRFDSNFEGGNLDLAFEAENGKIELFLRADSNSRGHSQWFNFKIWCKKSKRIRLSISNLVKPRAMYVRGGMPFLGVLPDGIATKEEDVVWRELDKSCNLKYERSECDYFLNIMKPKIYMNLEFDIELEENIVYQLCYSIPYSFSRLLRFTDKILSPSPFVKVETLCRSEGMLNCPLLTITAPDLEDTKYPLEKRPVIYFLARVHPSESASSYVVEGILERLISTHPRFDLLRKLFVIKVVPMVNPDGVAIGNFRTNITGDDLNRRYDKPHPFFNPTITAIRRMIDADKNAGTRIYAMFDLHGHSCRKNVFIYGTNVTQGSKKSQRARCYAYMLSRRTEMFRFENCIWRLRKNKKRTARGVLLNNNPTRYVFTVESSVFQYATKSKKGIGFTQRSYREMGVLLIDELASFVASTLLNYGSYFADYSSTNTTKASQDEKRKEHAEFKTWLLSIWKGCPVKPINNLIEETQKYESNMVVEEYSEGGSDSELSDDDFMNAERKQLLKKIRVYSHNFEKGCMPSNRRNFANQINKKIKQLSKKNFKGKVNEYKQEMETQKKFQRFLKSDLKSAKVITVCPQILHKSKSNPFAISKEILCKAPSIRLSSNAKQEINLLEDNTDNFDDSIPLTPQRISKRNFQENSDLCEKRLSSRLEHRRDIRRSTNLEQLQQKSRMLQVAQSMDRNPVKPPLLVPISIKTFDLDHLLQNHYEKLQRNREIIELRKVIRGMNHPSDFLSKY